jgi:hypothetical protein
MKQSFLVALCWFALCIGCLAQPPVYQLRIYKIHPGNEAHFHDRFRDQCMPIMKRYGFDIVFTSQSGENGHSEFVYLLRWKDRATQVSAWKAFLADPEWIAIKKSSSAAYGDLVDEVQDRSLDMLPYTPAPSQVP